MHVVKTMPAAPQILSRLSQIRLDPNVDLEDVTALLRLDAALTARIMRVANSAVYCQGEAYSSIEQALARIGFGEVYMIAGFAAIAQMANQNLRLYGVSGSAIRENSLLTALTAEALAELAGADTHEAYSAGLLRSVGKIALDGMVYAAGLLRSKSIALWGQTHKAALSTSYDPKTCGMLADWETEVVGIRNCEAAAFILNEWRFPAAIASAIGGHYVPEEVSSGSLAANLLNLAAGAAERRGFGLPGEEPYWDLRPERLAAAGVSEEQLESASERAIEKFKALHSAVS